MTVRSYSIKDALPLCPRCNHRHRLTKNSHYLMDECPHCNCPLHFSLINDIADKIVYRISVLKVEPNVVEMSRATYEKLKQEIKLPDGKERDINSILGLIIKIKDSLEKNRVRVLYEPE